jgi:hypothetical protein
MPNCAQFSINLKESSFILRRSKNGEWREILGGNLREWWQVYIVLSNLKCIDGGESLYIREFEVSLHCSE